MVSGSISLPSQGFFSSFTHATSALSVVSRYLALEGGPSRFTPGSTCLELLGSPNKKSPTFRLRGYHPLWQNFPESSAILNFCNFSLDLHIENIGSHYTGYKTNAVLQATGLGSFPFARRYSGNRFFFLFLGVLRCFSSPGYPP